MQVFVEGELQFHFAETVSVCKLDDTAFFTERFQSFAKPPDGEGSKAVDFVVLDEDPAHVWLVEVKDYRWHRRTKHADLVMEIARKVRDSLACIHAMASCGEGDERHFARRALQRHSIRIVLHREQSPDPRKLRHQQPDSKTLRLKLRQVLRAVDPNALAGTAALLNGKTPWTVRLLDYRNHRSGIRPTIRLPCPTTQRGR